MWKECGPCPVFASFTLAFALQLRKKHGKTSVGARKTSVSLRITSVRVQCTYYQNTHTNTHITKPTHTHTHTLQNNIKPPQHKLKQTQCKIYPKSLEQIKILLKSGKKMNTLGSFIVVSDIK